MTTDGTPSIGYFFSDPSRDRLSAAVPDLTELGFRFVSVFLAEKDDPSDSDMWCLHVERDDQLGAENLEVRNAALEEFAETHGLQSYDGSDADVAD